MRVTIGVIGKNEQHENDVVSENTMASAEEVGRLVAKRGGVIVTGGRFGVMEAASRGAKSADGLTVGFLPAMDPKTANAFVDLIFPTGLGRARNLLTARSCDALIMIGGSCGTLNELTIAYAEARPVVNIGQREKSPSFTAWKHPTRDPVITHACTRSPPSTVAGSGRSVRTSKAREIGACVE